MEKKTDSASLVKSAPATLAPRGSTLPAVRGARIAATAFAVAGAGGFLSLILSPSLLGAVVMALGFVSSAGLLMLGLLLRKGAASASSDIPPGVIEEDFRSLKRDLGKLRFQEGIKDRGERTYEQFAQSLERYKRFNRLLSEKFNEGEITYSRYHTAGTQAYLAILDNLRAVASILNNVGVIKAGYAENRIGKPEAGELSSVENEALAERVENRDRQMGKAEEILGLNEAGLTAFDRMNEAIAGIKTDTGWSGAEMQETLKELERLAERAPKYSL
ncbi:MAG: hypothetical protein HQK85_01700 [Nitrospinae bacterium]|nr:hypothetical protein [Nitrospinota bacterium]